MDNNFVSGSSMKIKESSKIPFNEINNPHKIMFPFNLARDAQIDFMNTYYDCLESGRDLLVSAPTGIGKTAASLAPAITWALRNDRTIFFLTSRSTQHKVVLETVAKIQDKFGKKIVLVDLIGKKWMCNQPNAQIMNPGEFSNFCKLHRECGSCTFFTNLKKKNQLSDKANDALAELKREGPLDVAGAIEVANKHEVCTYEISSLLAKDAKVIVGDYFHLYNPSIRNAILNRAKKNVSDLVVIVDEAHNLPNRIKDLGSINFNAITINRLTKILDQKLMSDAADVLNKVAVGVQQYMEHNLIRNGINELEIRKDDIMKLISNSAEMSYENLIDLLIECDEKLEEPKHKYLVQSLIDFLVEWEAEKHGHIRVLNYSKLGAKKLFRISFSCLDPSAISIDLLRSVHSTLLMSATLEPTKMYKDLLGLEAAESREYASVFSKENRINLIIPETSSRYSMRNDSNFKQIGLHIERLLNHIPGNVAIFFPSYGFRDLVSPYFQYKTGKTILFENPGMSKSDRTELISKFISYKETGAVLLGVASGSFAEGIDLPGDQLKGVIVVGIPLGTPDLTTKKQIDYYQKTYGEGWNYGYIYPAMSKTIQSAGRCIRTENDKGVIVFLESRYIHSNYYKCFPSSWHIKISRDYERLLNGFFEKPN